eukprot:symbB.v1.2.024563.t1/scaffold2335.1/size81964/1
MKGGNALRYRGSNFLRQRLVLSTVSGRPLIITDIRAKDEEPGLRDYEASFVRLLDKLCDGSDISIDETGTTLKYRPGQIIGGSGLVHTCPTSRCLTYFLEGLLLLAPLAKQPLTVRLKGVTNGADDVLQLGWVANKRCLRPMEARNVSAEQEHLMLFMHERFLSMQEAASFFGGEDGIEGILTADEFAFALRQSGYGRPSEQLFRSFSGGQNRIKVRELLQFIERPVQPAVAVAREEAPSSAGGSRTKVHLPGAVDSRYSSLSSVQVNSAEDLPAEKPVTKRQASLVSSVQFAEDLPEDSRHREVELQDALSEALRLLAEERRERLSDKAEAQRRHKDLETWAEDRLRLVEHLANESRESNAEIRASVHEALHLGEVSERRTLGAVAEESRNRDLTVQREQQIREALLCGLVQNCLWQMLKVMLFSLYQLDSISRHLLALGSRREPALQKNHRCPFSADGRDLSPSTMDVDYEDDAVEEGARPAGRRMKGRGGEEDDRYAGKAGKFERLDDDDDETGAARSIEGWVIIVSGVHEEAQEDDIFEAFSEYGDIKNLHLNLDRRTGFVKGYAFIEYENKQEADVAIKSMDGNTLLDHKLDVSWAFAKPGSKKKGRR